jgi:radical SAM protein with 4Fe4S-binding SPASM domain
MIPFFLLKVRKGKDYSMFNPVDNREYTVNYARLRILEHCDGAHDLEQIAALIAGDSGKTEEEAMSYISGFLTSMTKHGMISWRNGMADDLPACGPPETVFWDITSKCNLRCAHCYFNGEKPGKAELSTDEIKRVVEELAAYGIHNIAFSGGEPFMRKDAMEIISYAASHDFTSVNVATNGTLINRHVARKLKKAGINVQVSIDGDTASLHDAIRGINGAFDQAVRGIKVLQDANVPVTTCTVATTMNVNRIPAIIELMNKLHVDNCRVQGMMPMGRGNTNKKRLELTPSRMKKLVEYLESRSISISSYNFTLKDPPDTPLDFNGTGACAAATASCSITAEGNVVPCTHLWGLRAENVRDHTFKWIWENSAVMRYFRSISLSEIKGTCKDCRWLMVCHGGCKAQNYLAGNIFASNRSCWVADAARRSGVRKRAITGTGKYICSQQECDH